MCSKGSSKGSSKRTTPSSCEGNHERFDFQFFIDPCIPHSRDNFFKIFAFSPSKLTTRALHSYATATAMSSNHQDWSPVVLKKKAPSSGTAVKNVDDARRAGAQVAAIKKCACSLRVRWPAGGAGRARTPWARRLARPRKAPLHPRREARAVAALRAVLPQPCCPARSGSSPRLAFRVPSADLLFPLRSRGGQQRAQHGRTCDEQQQAGCGNGGAAPCVCVNLGPAADAAADERVSSELKTNIMKARLEKKMTQARVAFLDAETRT